MQRRAAAVYAVLFLVVAAGAYALIGAAEEPQIDVQGQSYAQNDTITEGGRTYTVASASDGEGTLEWTNESAAYSATWSNNTTVQMANNETYRVLIPNESDPGQFTLRQEFNLSDNTTTVQQGGTTYVVVNETDGNQSEGNKSLVPVDEYKRQQFGTPENRTYNEGQTFQYEGNQTTVSNITADSATLTWTAPRVNTVSVSAGANVSLGPTGQNTSYVAYFPSNSDGFVLSPQTGEYQTQENEISHFNERIAGLWGVVILSFLTVVLLLGMAFLPNK
ncbi:hypothetical protein [Halorussus halophilus]|uniref:hypothetical protein n=1 Tax=Halorussus halophilus TaxID=2650975 RepID=UPI001300F9B4|nr:hypothetical protein [Halorussus halophilus]